MLDDLSTALKREEQAEPDRAAANADLDRDKVSIDLWKYSEDRVTKLKDSMYTIVTWVIGLIAAVIGFAINNGFTLDKDPKIKAPLLLWVLGAVGCTLVVYAVVVIIQHGLHVQRAMGRATGIKSRTPHLREILEGRKAAEPPQSPSVPNEPDDNSSDKGHNVIRQIIGLPAIFWLLTGVVGLFGVASVALVYLGLHPQSLGMDESPKAGTRSADAVQAQPPARSIPLTK